MQLLKKIVVIGPESTGKSTLCEQLAAHYGTVWTPEYAREYLLTKGTEYTYADLLVIAKGQLALEDAGVRHLGRLATEGPATKSLAASRDRQQILFIDTDLYVMKVWSEFVFGRCDPWILDQIGSRQYDGYLLCKTDIPWAPDALREYPDLETREKLFHIYKDCLANQHTPWAEIGGQADERLSAAIDVVNRLVA